ncbi:MAG: hypothetical protein MJE66_03505 [Proteobacteria bacterium]|nr:hypothetical protein [Pseudomonadota bacterium]
MNSAGATGELATLLDGRPELFVQQRKEWVEILIDWETHNQYAVMDAEGSEVGRLVEAKDGVGGFLRRTFLGSHRSLRIGVLDGGGRLLAEFTRPFFWFFSTLSVVLEGRPRGCVRRRFGVVHRVYDLEDEHGRVFGRIRSPRWRIWTFRVYDEHGLHCATISKKWGGGLREIFSDADTFRIDFGSSRFSVEQRAVLLAAAICIDFDFFENNQGSGGFSIGD